MKIVFLFFPLVSALRFQLENETDISSLKMQLTNGSETALRVQEQGTQEWCMQFPYCPTGCSLFCTPEPLVAPVPPVPGTVHQAHYRSHRSHHHHSHRRRRRKESVQALEVADVVELAFNFPTTDALKGLTRKDVDKLNSNEEFRRKVKISLCSRIKKSGATCSLSEAEARVKNLILKFEGTSFLQVPTSDLLTRVDFSLRAHAALVLGKIPGDDDNVLADTVESLFSAEPSETELKTETIKFMGDIMEHVAESNEELKLDVDMDSEDVKHFKEDVVELAKDYVEAVVAVKKAEKAVERAETALETAEAAGDATAVTKAKKKLAEKKEDTTKAQDSRKGAAVGFVAEVVVVKKKEVTNSVPKGKEKPEGSQR